MLLKLFACHFAPQSMMNHNTHLTTLILHRQSVEWSRSDCMMINGSTPRIDLRVSCDDSCAHSFTLTLLVHCTSLPSGLSQSSTRPLYVAALSLRSLFRWYSCVPRSRMSRSSQVTNACLVHERDRVEPETNDELVSTRASFTNGASHNS